MITSAINEEINRLTVLLTDINEAIEDASEEDAIVEDIEEASQIAHCFLIDYDKLLYQLDTKDKCTLQYCFALKIEQIKCQLARLTLRLSHSTRQ